MIGGDRIKDWTGSATFVRTTNNRKEDAAQYDYYATEPKAVEILLQNEEFSDAVWEPACGEGHISKVLEANGYDVYSTDLVYRGFGEDGSFDFLSPETHYAEHFASGWGDIVTNPPYKYAKQFVERAMDVIGDGRKVAMFLKLTFLEGKARRELFEKYPPKTVYVFSGRVCCGKNGEFKPSENAVAYAWFVWEKGYTGDPVIKWVN